MSVNFAFVAVGSFRDSLDLVLPVKGIERSKSSSLIPEQSLTTFLNRSRYSLVLCIFS
jgi:hypothetical protein